MEFYEVLSRRRMNRAFRPDPIARHSIDRIVRSVRRAPSAGYAQGQSLIVVTDSSTRTRIAEGFLEPDSVADGGQPFISTAPVHIVVCASERLYHERYNEADKLANADSQEASWPVPYWYVDAGAAMMLILLAAIEEGLAACFIGNPDQKAILHEILGIPEHVVPIGIALIGNPADDPGAGNLTRRLAERRRPRDQVVKWERWTKNGDLAPSTVE